MALMEYCLVNIVLGDSPEPNETIPERSKLEKLYDLTLRGRRSLSGAVRTGKLLHLCRDDYIFAFCFRTVNGTKEGAMTSIRLFRYPRKGPRMFFY